MGERKEEGEEEGEGDRQTDRQTDRDDILTLVMLIWESSSY